MFPLILASTSRYRYELLSRLAVEFTAVAPNVDEDSFKNKSLDPVELAKTLALEKARAVARNNPHATVIGSDQVAALGETILDKPGTASNAKAQLTLMSGKNHALHTAVALVHPKGEVVFIESAELYMKNLTEAQIDRYITSDNPLDCAGSYKIESLGITLFDKIQTQDFTSITGLPLMLLSQQLNLIGYELP